MKEAVRCDCVCCLLHGHLCLYSLARTATSRASGVEERRIKDLAELCADLYHRMRRMDPCITGALRAPECKSCAQLPFTMPGLCLEGQKAEPYTGPYCMGSVSLDHHEPKQEQDTCLQIPNNKHTKLVMVVVACTCLSQRVSVPIASGTEKWGQCPVSIRTHDSAHTVCTLFFCLTSSEFEKQEPVPRVESAHHPGRSADPTVLDNEGRRHMHYGHHTLYTSHNFHALPCFVADHCQGFPWGPVRLVPSPRLRHALIALVAL